MLSYLVLHEIYSGVTSEEEKIIQFLQSPVSIPVFVNSEVTFINSLLEIPYEIPSLFIDLEKTKPITSPSVFTIGPPESPGATDAANSIPDRTNSPSP